MTTIDPISHLRQLTDTAIASQRPSDALAVDQALRLLEAEELLACSERRVSIGRYIKGGASEENLAKLRLWVDEAKRTQRSTDFNMVIHCLTIIEAEETLAKVAERAQRREQVKTLPPFYEYATVSDGEHAFKAPDGRVFGPYVNKASMHGDAWTHAMDPDLFIAPTPGADELLTPEEYEAALACEVSDTEIYNAIEQAMQEALASRAPFFRVSVPSVALERAKAMLVKWDVRETGRPVMRERGGHLVHLKVSPKPPAFEVFLVGDVVVVAEDVDNARLLTSGMTNSLPMVGAFFEGFVATDPRQVDSSEVLTVYLWDDGPHTETRGTFVTKTAGDWARSSGRGVLGPLDGSQLAQRIGGEGRLILCSTDTQIGRDRPAPREHKPQCNGVPCYCDDEVLVTDGTYFDAARETHLYFIGPNFYVAESEEAALQFHRDAIVVGVDKLEELRRSVAEEAPSEAEMASRHIDAMLVEVNRVYDIRHVLEDEALPDIVELYEESVQTSPKSYDDWRRGKMGSVGLLLSYYKEVITPHIEAIMGAASVAAERRLQDVRGKLGIGEESHGT